MADTTDDELKPARMGELYLPCVLSRLIDQNPEVRAERYPHVVSAAGLRQSVLENVSMILNSSSHPTAAALKDDPLLMTSVLGFGLTDFCGISHCRRQREALRQEIVRQLSVFEPRLDSRVTDVSFVADEETCRAGVLDIEVRSVISVEPLRAELAFRARLSLESGEAIIDEMTVDK